MKYYNFELLFTKVFQIRIWFIKTDIFYYCKGAVLIKQITTITLLKENIPPYKH